MKINNVLDTTPKKSAMDGVWIDNVYTTKFGKGKQNLPKLGKTFMGKDYGPDSAKYKGGKNEQ